MSALRTGMNWSRGSAPEFCSLSAIICPSVLSDDRRSIDEMKATARRWTVDDGARLDFPGLRMRPAGAPAPFTFRLPSCRHNLGPDSEIAGSELPASDSPLATAGAPSREKVSYRALLALGVTGGMVPCPAALVVLLSAVALRRVGFGLFLILAFSVGLAAVLIAVGLLMVYAGRFMSRLKGEGPLVTRWLPLASAAFITVLGLIITVRALVGAGVLQIHL